MQRNELDKELASSINPLLFGCFILVHMRENPGPGPQSEPYHNHYAARRLVTSEGYEGHWVPAGLLAELFGIRKLAESTNEIAEGMFFVARIWRAWADLKRDLRLDSKTHWVKIAPARGYRFPARLFAKKAFKDLLLPYAPPEDIVDLSNQ
jgi:hypothetical protein